MDEDEATNAKADPAAPAARSEPTDEAAPGAAGGPDDALRAREAARFFALASEHHRRGDLEEALQAYANAVGPRSRVRERV